MMLSDIVSVRSDIGASDITDINTAIAFGLEGATVALEGRLDTPFDFGAYVNDYAVGDVLWFAGRPQVALKLWRGFLSGAPTVTFARTFADLTTLPTTVTADNFVADLELGVVNLLGLDLAGCYVRVAYSAGFNADSNEKDLFDLSEVPEWLQTAARLQTRLSLHDAPFLKDGEDESTVKQIEAMLDSIVAKKQRRWMDTLDSLTRE